MSNTLGQKANYAFLKLTFFLALILLCAFGREAYGFSSMLEYENKAQETNGIGYFGVMDLCFDSGKAIPPWRYNEFESYLLPIPNQSKEETERLRQIDLVSSITATTAVRVVVFGILTTLAGPLAAALLGIDFATMIDYCTNIYVLQPNEYVNREFLGLKCKKNASNQYYFETKNAGTENEIQPLSPEQVPFYYTCDPKYDFISNSTTDDPDKYGTSYGYMGLASDFCQGELKEVANKKEFYSKISSILFEFVPGIFRWGSFFNPAAPSEYGQPCNANYKEGPFELRVGQKKGIGLYHVEPYYNVNYEYGKFQICLAAPGTLLPLKLGCSQVAPIPDYEKGLAFVNDYLDQSMCSLFLTGRTDLHSLGDALDELDSDGKKKDYVKNFLKSDMHLTSTVVGCLQDMLYRVFIGSALDKEGGSTFFTRFKDALRGIALSILTLYLAIVGIQFISDPELTQKRGELLMLVIKFAAVFYFSVGNPWFNQDGDRREGLLPFFMNAPSELTGIILQSYNQNDPIGFCSYNLQNEQLFDKKSIEINSFQGELQPTPGYDYLKLSVWDLLDCKVANYMNFGSCKYTFLSTLAWIGPTAFWGGGLGFMLLVISFLYLFLLLLMVYKFVHIFLLTMFIITIMVFFGPIFVLFALFKSTMQIFKTWFTMLLGYILYPALNFVFISFLLATLDIANYGEITKYIEQNPEVVSSSEDINLRQLCARSGSQSATCTTITLLGYDNPCLDNSVSIPKQFVYELNFGFFFTDLKIQVLRPEIIEMYLLTLVRLLLFTFLFYFLMGSMLEFMAVVLGIWMPTGAMGGLNIANPLGSALGKMINIKRASDNAE